MPRTYERTPGSRRYIDYSKETLQECLDLIKSGLLSQREAEKRYKIPRSTIKHKLKGQFPASPGHPTIFNENEELAFVSHIIKLSEFGFPMDELDLRFSVKSYLSLQGRNVNSFKNNLPGRDWAKLFLKRHPQLTIRIADNIKRARAAITETVCKEFMENLGKTIEDVPAQNIWNYDETNLSDDPGRKRCITRRGTKYPERVINTSKTSTSVMFCGNAVGDTLPPYVVYKAEHLWSTWCENGPHGTRYNRTTHGWFDNHTFEDWFSSHLLPRLKKYNGKKVVIGDNLSSHINPNVLAMCQENNIDFICLPPNSTHWTQPLDVAYFRPLKSRWREALLSWKESATGERCTVLPKDQFPLVLKDALSKLDTSKENLVSGFRKTGIFPHDVHALLDRLPSRLDVNIEMVGNAFMDRLENKRQSILSSNKTRRRRLAVPPGKSIGNNDLPIEEEEQAPKQKRGRPQKKSVPSDSLISEDESNSSKSPEKSEDDARQSKVNLTSKPTSCIEENLKDSLMVGNFVCVSWQNQLYPGVVTKLEKHGIYADCMHASSTGRYWIWPEAKDILFYQWQNVIKKINPPKKLKRGLFSVQLDC